MYVQYAYPGGSPAGFQSFAPSYAQHTMHGPQHHQQPMAATSNPHHTVVYGFPGGQQTNQIAVAPKVKSVCNVNGYNGIFGSVYIYIYEILYLFKYLCVCRITK